MSRSCVSSVAQRVVRRVADSNEPTSLASKARAKRWRVFHDRFPELGDMRVLDLGGTPWAWDNIWPAPVQVTCVNLDPDVTARADHRIPIEVVHADACEPPDRLLTGHDIVISNSVIEHVGGLARRRQLADIIRAAAPEHWVQTPARSFPIEPHWMCPGFQWLPVRTRAWLSPRWPLASPEYRRQPPEAALDDVLEVELLSAAEWHQLFPTSVHLVERAAGLAKSYIASTR
jgi:hypothetical protein